MVPPTSGGEDENDDGDDYSAGDFDSLDKAIRNLRLSRRTLLSNKESGFVSETNELTTTDSTRNKRSSSRGGNTTSTRSNRKSTRSSSNKPVVIRSAAAAAAVAGSSSSRHHHHQQNPAPPPPHHFNNTKRLSSTSSWLRRVLRLKRSSQGYTSSSRKHKNDYSAAANYFDFSKKRGHQNSPGLLRVNSSKSRVSSL